MVAILGPYIRNTTVNREISLYEIFVGKIFMLKNFRRVDVLRKYFNTKILQHRSREECTERVAAMENFFERNYIRGYHVYKKYGRRRLERRWCAQKLFQSIRCGCEKRRNYHRTFTSKAVAGVFAVFATGKYTVASGCLEHLMGRK